MYTEAGIMSQIYVALGQGTGPFRVSQAACLALHDHYFRRITGEVIQIWSGEAVQVLERIRAIGRLLAANASVAGRTAITGREVIAAAKVVERESDTTLCGGGPPPKARLAPDQPGGSARDEESAAAAPAFYTRDGIMAQVLVAFGQGTGPVRVGQQACLELREHYYDRITDEVIAVWGRVAVQVLERIRAIGRLVAANAAAAGQTAIKGSAVRPAATLVERESDTDLCPPHRRPRGDAADRVEVSLGQPAAAATLALA